MLLPGAPLIFNESSGNIQGSLDGADNPGLSNTFHIPIYKRVLFLKSRTPTFHFGIMFVVAFLQGHIPHRYIAHYLPRQNPIAILRAVAVAIEVTHCKIS